jgi:hypothetical protein
MRFEYPSQRFFVQIVDRVAEMAGQFRALVLFEHVSDLFGSERGDDPHDALVRAFATELDTAGF